MNLQRQTNFSVSSEGVPIRNISDYSPFGVQLDGRTIQGDFYRYGYQGSEKDDESKGGGNSYTTFFRQLDPRVGRWFSVDPVFQPWQSPYCSMDGNPISLNDILGNSAGDYFDSETNEHLGSDGVNDGLEYKIKKDDFNNITNYDGYKKLSNENKKKWLTSDSKVSASKAYNHEYSKNNGCSGSSTKYNGNNEIDNKVFSKPKKTTPIIYNEEGAKNFSSSIGSFNNAVEITTKTAEINVPNSVKSFSKSTSYVTTIYDGAVLLNETSDAIDLSIKNKSWDPVMNQGIKDGAFLFETLIVDKALTSGVPHLMVGAGIYYAGKFILFPEGKSNTNPINLPNSYKDQDNTRTNGASGPTW